MSIRKPERLKDVLSDPQGLARAFSRHTYGMLVWVDLFGYKIQFIEDVSLRAIVTRIIADNAKHAKLFANRAKEMGETPEAYNPPEIGQRIYNILRNYVNVFDDFAYAWGALIHFSALLDLYSSVADPRSRDVILQVQTDVIGHLVHLERYFAVNADTQEKRKRVQEIKAIVDNAYSDREDEEIKWYAL